MNKLSLVPSSAWERTSAKLRFAAGVPKQSFERGKDEG